MVTLDVYVETGCLICSLSEELARRVEANYPQVVVRVMDGSSLAAVRVESIVAAPTFLINGHIFKLGNPSYDELREAVERTIRDTSEPLV